MKLKFLKYSFTFILDPRAKLRGLFNVLQILKENTGCDYNSYYADEKTEIYNLFNKYKRKFGATRSQRAAQPVSHIGKKKTNMGKKSLETLDHMVLLVLPQPLPALHLNLLLLLLVGSQLIWTVTISLHMRMTSIYFFGDVTTN
jgi:hypothetical protein